MIGKPVVPLPAGCPWSDWAPATLKHCENNLCSWVTAPAYTWSNLSYVLVGLWLWRQASREGTKSLKFIGPIAVIVGIFSGLYHASFTYFFQIFDYASMYMYSGLLIVLNLRRLKVVSLDGQLPAYAAIVVLSALPFVFLKSFWGIALFGANIAAAIVTEIWALKKNRDARGEPIRYLHWWLNFGCFVVAYIFWILDYSGVWCDPDNHFIQGHAVWHVVVAFCFLFARNFYRQFQFLE